MQQKVQAMYVTLLDVGRFLDRHADSFTATNGAAARATLREVVKELEGDGMDQFWSHKRATSGTVDRTDARETLRNEHMQPITAIASAKLLGESPTLMQKFTLPDVHTRDVVLLVQSRAMHAAAAEYSSLFEKELGPDFLGQLERATNAFQEALVERNSNVHERRRATGGLDVTLFKARELLRVLNGLVLREARSRPDLLIAWRMVKRVPRKPGAPQGSTGGGGPAGTASASTAQVPASAVAGATSTAAGEEQPLTPAA